MNRDRNVVTEKL